MFATYILASRRNGTIYVGSTDDLARRIWEHREKLRPGFTTQFGVSQLVWFESHETREGAFRRERRIKEWRRSWKIMLIEAQNPDWRDMYDDLTGGGLKPDVWLAALGDGCLDEIRRDL